MAQSYIVSREFEKLAFKVKNIVCFEFGVQWYFINFSIFFLILLDIVRSFSCSLCNGHLPTNVRACCPSLSSASSRARLPDPSPRSSRLRTSTSFSASPCASSPCASPPFKLRIRILKDWLLKQQTIFCHTN